MVPPFSKVSPATWRLNSNRDWHCTSFEELVEQLVAQLNVEFLYRNEFKNQSWGSFYRPIVKINAGYDLVKAFHCAEFGYRAQYYLGENNGDEANRYFMGKATPKILEGVEKINKYTCKVNWVEKSLQSEHTKIWIHQGLWLRQNSRDIRRLKVDRWVKQICNPDSGFSKKAKWSQLVPQENRLEIKGGFIKLNGDKLPIDPKPERASEIHRFGFT